MISDWKETGGFIFWDKSADILYAYEVQGEGLITELPTATSEFKALVASFQKNKQDMVFLMFYHTHPNGLINPSNDDMSTLRSTMWFHGKNQGVGLIISGESVFTQE